MRPLVILRPEPGATATAEAARRLSLKPIRIPLFMIEPLAWTAPDPSKFDGLLITSANAIRFGGPELLRLGRLPVHAVGEATAAAARAAGLTVETVGSAGIEALLASIASDLKLLHLCAADHREPKGAKQSIGAIPVYHSAQLPLPRQFGQIDGAVVMVHSPRAAMRLAELAAQTSLPRNRTTIAAISTEAAIAAGAGWQGVEAADEPHDHALLALAAPLCQNPA